MNPNSVKSLFVESKKCRFVNDVLHIKENGNHVIGRQIAKRTHRSIV